VRRPSAGPAVLAAGSALFLVAAFLPISNQVFAEPSPARRVAAVEAAPGAWLADQVLFALGAVVAVTGAALLARRGPVRTAAPLGAAAAILTRGAVPWLWYVVARTVDPVAFAAGAIPSGLAAISFVLTGSGVALVGVALLRSGLPRWLGWGVTGAMLGCVAVTLAVGDMVPLVFYVAMLEVFCLATDTSCRESA
jgi:hypothetical protein